MATIDYEILVRYSNCLTLSCAVRRLVLKNTALSGSLVSSGKNLIENKVDLSYSKISKALKCVATFYPCVRVVFVLTFQKRGVGKPQKYSSCTQKLVPKEIFSNLQLQHTYAYACSTVVILIYES